MPNDSRDIPIYHILVGIALVVVLLALIPKITLIVFFGAVLAAVLDAAARWLAERVSVSRTVALLIVTSGLVLIAVALGFVIAPSIYSQGKDIAKDLPEAWGKVESWLKSGALGSQVAESVPSWSSISGNAGKIISTASTAFGGLISFVTIWLLLAVLAFYFALDAGQFTDATVRLFPHWYRDRAREVLERLGEVVTRWMMGKLSAMVFLAICSYIGLSLLGVPYALTFALLQGTLAFIPNFGTLIATALPALTVAFQDPLQGLYVVLFFAGLQAVEGNVVTPFLMREAIELPPALLITGQVVLAALFGFWGLLVAAPLTAVIVTLTQEIYMDDVLDEDEGNGDTQTGRKAAA